MNLQDWQEFTTPKLALRFSYPTRSAQGVTAKLNEVENERLYRVHLLTPARDLYFEVTRYTNLTATEAYEQLKHDIEQSAALDYYVSPLDEITFADQPAFTFSLKRDDIERVVILIPRESDLHRLLYNPQDPTNEQILATVTFS